MQVCKGRSSQPQHPVGGAITIPYGSDIKHCSCSTRGQQLGTDADGEEEEEERCNFKKEGARVEEGWLDGGF